MGDWSEAGAMSESAQTPAATNAPSTARSGAGQKLGRAPAIVATVGGLLIFAAIGMELKKADVGLPASDTAPPTGDRADPSSPVVAGRAVLP
jgi:hypothetical protein